MQVQTTHSSNIPARPLRGSCQLHKDKRARNVTRGAKRAIVQLQQCFDPLPASLQPCAVVPLARQGHEADPSAIRQVQVVRSIVAIMEYAAAKDFQFAAPDVPLQQLAQDNGAGGGGNGGGGTAVGGGSSGGALEDLLSPAFVDTVTVTVQSTAFSIQFDTVAQFDPHGLTQPAAAPMQVMCIPRYVHCLQNFRIRLHKPEYPWL